MREVVVGLLLAGTAYAGPTFTPARNGALGTSMLAPDDWDVTFGERRIWVRHGGDEEVSISIRLADDELDPDVWSAKARPELFAKDDWKCARVGAHAECVQTTAGDHVFAFANGELAYHLDWLQKMVASVTGFPPKPHRPATAPALVEQTARGTKLTVKLPEHWQLRVETLGSTPEIEASDPYDDRFNLIISVGEPGSADKVKGVACARGGGLTPHWMPGDPEDASCVRGDKASGRAIAVRLIAGGATFKQLEPQLGAIAKSVDPKALLDAIAARKAQEPWLPRHRDAKGR